MSSQDNLPCFQKFYQDMKAEYKKISLSQEDIKDRKELIQFVRNKLRNREYEEDDEPWQPGQSYYDTGL